MIATLTTERLILRPIAQSDAPAIQREFATWDIIQHLTLRVPWPYPDDGAEVFLRDIVLPAMADGRVMAWAIVRKGGPGELIGFLE
ncbi:MAG: ribosomal-protein-alanine N-acetyltransferase, partial [Myxococcota bacterium]